MKNQEIIDEIKRLFSFDEIKIEQIEESHKYTYEPINNYLRNLLGEVKPETALSELFRDLLTDTCNIQKFPERNIHSGFVDYVIKDKIAGNPILIELKPIFIIKNKKQQTIRQTDLDFKQHKDQIQKYLKSKDTEYIILRVLT